ncbi:MAG: hypothetical protein HY885_05535 [Deltaproteobacteria bacterium]|nr:hypothetical protein [Deltaproteobacteria bacterium]
MKKKGDIVSVSPPIQPSKSLYLAREIKDTRMHYSLRQTYRDEAGGLLLHREIFALGDSPQQFIIYLGDHGYGLDDALTEAISPYIAGDGAEMAEKLLWPFVRKEVRAKLEPFMNRGGRPAITKVTAEEQAAIDREIHLFDRRRLHFLWYGAIDQSGLYRMPAKLCRKLLGKSRDEKEQYFIEREQVFHADQVKEYLFTIFDLQRHFSQSYARIMPQGLDQDELDGFMVEELCRLNEDKEFWLGMDKAAGLRPYLIRYLIMFFDYDFSASQALDDYIRQFLNSHRQFRFPQKNKPMDMNKASEIFGEPAESLAKMNDRELTRLYRRRAKELHPDTGGEHDKFVRLKEAFEALLRKR